MSITKGQTFGSTEQITNTKLHALVDSATISLEHTEIANNMLTSLATTAGMIPSYILMSSLASGATLKYDGSTGIYGV